MSTQAPLSFPCLLQQFFVQQLMQQLHASPRTVAAYRDSFRLLLAFALVTRDTWRLFLRFASARHKKAVVELALAHLTAAEVLAFLQHSEQERKVSVGTRNCRLAALRSFFSFVAGREPLAVAQCADVLHIPTKKAATSAPCYLELHEIEAILAQPDRSTLEGQRDHTLLWFLYNTGARIQEALDLRLQAIRFDSPACVRLFGKGRKERICPLWPETVQLLKALHKRQPRNPQEPVFVNRYGEPLGASGVRFKLAQYVEAAAKTVPSLSKKHISPHAFRHATAVQLVAAGVDVTVIRSWLGHANLDTTNHYAQANLETKRMALEKIDPASKSQKPPRWKRNEGLLAWLDSL